MAKTSIQSVAKCKKQGLWFTASGYSSPRSNECAACGEQARHTEAQVKCTHETWDTYSDRCLKCGVTSYETQASATVGASEASERIGTPDQPSAEPTTCDECKATVSQDRAVQLEDQDGPTGKWACCYCVGRWQSVEPDSSWLDDRITAARAAIEAETATVRGPWDWDANDTEVGV